jgi:hypothetical protein
MAYPENFPKNSDEDSDPRKGPHAKGVESEETEMIQNDPAKRAVPGVGMDALGESGDRDPLLGSAVGDVDEATRTGDGGRAADPAEDASRDHEAGEPRGKR